MPTADTIELQAVKNQLELFHLIFDSIHNGAMVTDANGVVTHLNKPYARFLELDAAESIGKHCTEVVENTRMHIVAQTGVPEISQTQMIRGQNILVHRIPIKREGQVIAVFGLVMFQDVGEVVRLAKKLRHLESQVKRYKKKLMSSAIHALHSGQHYRQQPGHRGTETGGLGSGHQHLPGVDYG